MRKIVIGGLFLFAISVTVTLNVLEVKAQSVKCFNVSSRQGWQNFDLGGPYTRVVNVRGG
jgi:hypothetical protein